ncbi:MAG: cupin domain-containing protein [Acidobacteriota bacterium]
MTEERRQARKIRWSDLETDHPMPLLDRQRIHGEKMTVARVRLEKGFKIDPHAHDEEQISLVVSGQIRFLVGAPPDQEEIIATANEALVLPPNVPHGAEALEDSLAIDLFSPPAQQTGIDRAGD